MEDGSSMRDESRVEDGSRMRDESRMKDKSRMKDGSTMKDARIVHPPYSCRKCRETLEIAKAEVLPCDCLGTSCCIYLDVEQSPEWIRDAVGESFWTKGKLQCPNCKGRLGSFDFLSTSLCPCKRRGLPAVHLLKNRVDRLQGRSRERVRVQQHSAGLVASIDGALAGKGLGPSREHQDIIFEHDSSALPWCPRDISADERYQQSVTVDDTSLVEASDIVLHSLHGLEMNDPSHMQRARSKVDWQHGADINLGMATKTTEDSSHNGHSFRVRFSFLEASNSPAELDDVNVDDLAEAISELDDSQPTGAGIGSHSGTRALPVRQDDSQVSVLSYRGDNNHFAMLDCLEDETDNGDMIARTDMVTPEGGISAPVRTGNHCGLWRRPVRHDNNRFAVLVLPEEESDGEKDGSTPEGVRHKVKKNDDGSKNRKHNQKVEGYEKEDRYEVPEEFTCPICYELFVYPSVCRPCGHVFCDPCLRRLCKSYPSNTKCPMCREVIRKCDRETKLEQSIWESTPKQYKRRCHSQRAVNKKFYRLPSYSQVQHRIFQERDRVQERGLRLRDVRNPGDVVMIFLQFMQRILGIIGRPIRWWELFISVMFWVVIILMIMLRHRWVSKSISIVFLLWLCWENITWWKCLIGVPILGFVFSKAGT